MSVESESDEITKSRPLLVWRKRDAESTGECPTGSGAGADNSPGDEPAGDPFPEGDGQPARAHDQRRTPALERLLARTGAIGKRWERERSTAGLLYQCLVAEGPARRAELLATDQRFASPALVENVLSEAGEAARNRPAAALEHVEMALAIIERIDALRFAGGALAGLRVAAQARKAEALWWGGDPPGAKAVLLGALDDVEETPVAGLERALYCRVTALVRAGQGRSDEGLALLGRACQIYYQEQETAALAECLVERGWLLAEADPRTAVPPLRRALSLIDPVARPWAALRVRQCLALCHAELGNGAEAEPMLRQSRRLRKRISEEADFLRATQTEGQVEARLGHQDRAIALMRLVIEGWLDRGEGFLAALSVIDLAELYADEKRQSDLATLEELGPRLRAAGLPSEAAVAIRVVLRIATREGDAAVYPLTHLHSYLSRAQYDSALAYFPSRVAADLIAWDELLPERRRAVCELVGIGAEVGDSPAAIVPAELRKLITWSYQELSGVEIEWSRLDALQAGLSNLVEALLVVQGEVRALQERLPVFAHPDLGTSGGEKAESTEDALAPGGAIDSLIVGELERVISRLKGAPEGEPGLDSCG